MKTFKYFFEFLIIISLFAIFKIIGLKNASALGALLAKFIGPLFRSKKIITANIQTGLGAIDKKRESEIISAMWSNIGRTFAEYIFLKKFKFSEESLNHMNINGKEYLEDIKKNNEVVIFYSAHLANFELMAMELDKSGIKCAAIYRPLNNFFLNPIMEKMRKKHICKKQIKKGISGTKEILKNFKSGYSVALMIDQRVSQGIKSLFFGQEALTTTIPAQFVKKFNCKIIPIFIERKNNEKFNLEIMSPINFNNDQTIEDITLKLNQILEKMIIRNPHQWIWSHNRWK